MRGDPEKVATSSSALCDNQALRDDIFRAWKARPEFMTLKKNQLPEVLGALSIVADIGVGVPGETGIGAAILAGRIGLRLGLSDGEGVAAFYASLLRYTGCSVAIPETVSLTLGDVHGYQRALSLADLADPADTRWWLDREMAPDGPAESRAEALDRLDGVHSTAEVMVAITRSHCDLARQLAGEIGMPSGVKDALDQIYERSDGRGLPAGISGGDLSIPARVMHVTTAFELQRRKMGLEWAVAQVRARKGGQFCPGICDAVLSDPDGLVAGMDASSLMDLFLDEAPEFEAASDLTLAAIARACGLNVDHRSVYTLGHSSAVADLVVRAAECSELNESMRETLRIAAYLHDVGKAGLPAALLDKAPPLSRAEQTQMEQHTYLTDSILRATSAFAPYARLASSTQERADGSGYHRQIRTPEFHVQLLAACDAYCTLRQDGPGRKAQSVEQASGTLLAESKAGKWDPMVVRAVCHAESGHQASLGALPNGLSKREAEVVCLMARGLSNKEIATELFISPKTVEHHVGHVYDKIGTRTRASAALFAVRHRLVARTLAPQ